jgi:NTE family protein
MQKSVYKITTVLFSLVVIFSLLFSQKTAAQEASSRKKIGLVLSGGGAKGFAHIGVLKVIEEAGVKIDFIGGTSMGAVVGGLYASGYNASQIDSIFQETNFDELLSDYIPRSSKSFFEKYNDQTYAISLPFNKFNLGVPVALSKGMYNYNLLCKLTNNVRHTRDFNKLPIPFLCIATDIEKGKSVVLNEGYLPLAILASSAFPSLFAPVEIDGKLLIDGGVSNNYPIDEVKKMGADIIIGVDVQDDLKDRSGLMDATRILVQISNIQMIEGMKDKINKTDVYIKPDISKFTVLSFNEGKSIVKTGEEAAFSVYEKIKLLGNKEVYKVQRHQLNSDSIKIDGIGINEVKNYTRSYIIGKLGFKEGENISFSDLKSGINKLDATQNFSSISYKLEEGENGDNLHINLKESSNKTFLKFGLHFDGLYKSALLVNLTQKKLLAKNDVFSIDVGLGDNFRYNLDYYIDNGFHFSFGFKSRFNQFNRNVSTDFNDGQLFANLGIQRLGVEYMDFTNRAYLQTVFAQKFLVGGGFELKYLKITSETLPNITSILDKSYYSSLFGYVIYDSFDNRYFPKKGWMFNGDIQSFVYSNNFSNQYNNFTIAKAETAITRTFFNKLNLKLQADAGMAFGNISVHTLDFVLGGYGFNAINNFKHFYGYDFLAIAADSYVKALTTVDVEFYKKNHVNFSANFANAERGLFKTGNWLSTPQYTGYAVGYGLETIIGPIEVKYSWSPELSRGYTWFNLGFWF